jgi:hypothetical protein
MQVIGADAQRLKPECWTKTNLDFDPQYISGQLNFPALILIFLVEAP